MLGVGLRLLERPHQVEAALWRRLRFENDEDARRLLFDRYLVLARRIARREYRGRPAYGLERSDFEQLAFGGLLEAIDRFDPLRGAPFEAFARHRIRGAVSDGVSRASEGSAQYTHRRRIEMERLRSIQEGATATADYIQALSDLSTALAIGLIAEYASLSGEPLHDALHSYDSLAWRDLQQKVLGEIERLPDVQRTVLQQHYLHDVSFTQIARLLGVTKGRVSQIHRSALLIVRGRLGPKS